MPGLPAVGGWGGSNRTLGITMEGFTDEEIAKAVDHCDNDKIRTIKYLQGLKAKGGGRDWKKDLEKMLPTLDSNIRGLAQRLMGYDNVPNKQKTFVNFAKNSLALQRSPQLAEKLWEVVGDLLKKPVTPAPEAKPKKETNAEEEEAEDAEEEGKKSKKDKKRKAEEADEEEEGEKKKKKKDKKEKKEKKSKEADEEDEEEEDESEKKKDKKDKKKKDKKKEVEEEEEEEEEESQKKDQKKDKKDKKKSKDEDEDKMEVEEEEEKPKKDKKDKKKKSKKGDSDHEDGDDKPAPKKKEIWKGTSKYDFYKESPAVKGASKAVVDNFRKEKEIAIENFDLNPIFEFKDANLDASIMKCCSKFEHPTPIQAQCWPVCLSGRDLVGIAETGSGKTVAFGLPGLTHIKEQGQVKCRTPVMLVIAPTRELAMQSEVVLKAAGEPVGVSTLCVYGGVSKGEQKAQLKKGVQILVATPGRLLDLMNEGYCDVSKVTYLVLDEADRMLDMGFEEDMRKIIKQCSADRQTVMFSATWPQSIQKVAAEFLRNPARITVGSPDLAANHRVTQIVEVVDPAGKDRRLVEMLKKYHDRKNRIIIFVLYKKEADRVNLVVEKAGFNVLAIHGDRSQEQRSAAVEKFKSGVVPLLIATDVAARGLDIPGVEYVLNYTFPLTVEDYVHRIGRTGRAGKTGTAHTLFTLHDKIRAGELVNVLREASQEVPEELLKFGTHVKKKEHTLFGAHFKDVDMNVKATKKTFDDSDDE